MDTGYEDFLVKAQQSFFPNGINPTIGLLSDYHHMSIVNGHNVCVKKMELIFSIENYIQEKMVAGSIRFFLLCNSEAFDNHDTDVDAVGLPDLSQDNLFPCESNEKKRNSDDATVIPVENDNHAITQQLVPDRVITTINESVTTCTEGSTTDDGNTNRNTHIPSSPSGEVSLMISEQVYQYVYIDIQTYTQGDKTDCNSTGFFNLP